MGHQFATPGVNASGLVTALVVAAPRVDSSGLAVGCTVTKPMAEVVVLARVVTVAPPCAAAPFAFAVPAAPHVVMATDTIVV